MYSELAFTQKIKTMTMKTPDPKKGPPFDPDENKPVKPDNDPDPTEHEGNDPEKNDPTRIQEPAKTDPTRIDQPTTGPTSPKG